ncbi:MAG: hypothetical protein SGCHY_001572 [Lobulomycetales sp.]
MANKGQILNNESAELAKRELDAGVPFGTHLTKESIRSLQKENKTNTFWSKLKKLFSAKGQR